MENVTIIVPIYNVEQYVEKCINSLLNQTFKDIKILAISDGSPDNSVKILNKIDDERLVVVEKENGGYGSVLEYGIANTHSKYFMICDPDDWLEEDAVELLYTNIEEHNVDFVAADYYKIFTDNKKYAQCFPNRKFSISENVVYEEIENFIYGKASPHSKIFKTTIAKNIIFPNKVSYTDCVLFYIYLSRSKKALWINKPLSYYFFDRPGNSMSDVSNYSLKTCGQFCIVIKSIINQIDKQSELFSCIISQLYTLLLSNYLGKVKEIKQASDKKKANKLLEELFVLIRPYKTSIDYKSINGAPKCLFYRCLLTNRFFRHIVFILKMEIK